LLTIASLDIMFAHAGSDSMLTPRSLAKVCGVLYVINSPWGYYQTKAVSQFYSASPFTTNATHVTLSNMYADRLGAKLRQHHWCLGIGVCKQPHFPGKVWLGSVLIRRSNYVLRPYSSNQKQVVLDLTDVMHHPASMHNSCSETAEACEGIWWSVLRSWRMIRLEVPVPGRSQGSRHGELGADIMNFSGIWRSTSLDCRIQDLSCELDLMSC